MQTGEAEPLLRFAGQGRGKPERIRIGSLRGRRRESGDFLNVRESYLEHFRDVFLVRERDEEAATVLKDMRILESRDPG